MRPARTHSTPPATELRGELRLNEPLAQHTSWRVGGPARRFYRPADLADLAHFLAQLADDEPLLWLGLGSNLLVRDGGFGGTVIHTLGRLGQIHLLEGQRLWVECGASCAALARFAARKGLCGAEFLAGIPGTLGGAVAMNAGAFGGETWPLVYEVQTIDRQGRLRLRPTSDYRVGYRQVVGPEGEWFAAAGLQLRRGDPTAPGVPIQELLQRRAHSQPMGVPSCGSVFKNPPGDHAARLIEAAGLKGQCLGGAQVSPKHANFIINTGKATAADIEAMILRVAQQVKEQFGISLETEVRIVGEEAEAHEP